MKREVELAKKLLEGKGYSVSEKMNEYVEFRCKLPATWEDNGHNFNVTRTSPGRFGLRVDGESMMSTSSLHDVHEYLQKHYDTIIPGTIVESKKMNESSEGKYDVYCKGKFYGSSEDRDGAVRLMKDCYKSKFLDDPEDVCFYDPDGVQRTLIDEVEFDYVNGHHIMKESSSANREVNRSSAPARNDDSTREEKLAYARDLLKGARQEGDQQAAWDLVDFLWDTDLLNESKK